MRLLIVTQAIDRNDPVLGFFHQWVEEFARQGEYVHVICLKQGEYSLPANVSVHSLGKEGGKSRLKYISRFYKYMWRLRREYNVVFVHMNQEYVLLGGLVWRLLGKRVVLWRNHAKGSALTSVAVSLAHAVAFTSPEAYVATAPHSTKMPIGIDTNKFRPQGRAPRDSVLFFGRLDPVKNPHIFLDALDLLRAKKIFCTVRMVGSSSERGLPYMETLRTKADSLVRAKILTMNSSIPPREAPGLFASHAIYVNLTPSGSFDKTIGEALASGCIPVLANRALGSVVPEELLVDPKNPESVASGIMHALKLSDAERTRLSRELRAYVEKEHSLSLLMERLLPVLNS